MSLLPRSRTLPPRLGFLGAIAAAVLLAAPPQVQAQHAGGAQPPVTRPPAEANQWDFLVGQWDLKVEPVVSGLAGMVHGSPAMTGSWKAWRALDGWGVEDEMRIVDISGNPMALTHLMRVYDASTKRWRISAVDAYRAAMTQSIASLDGGEMTISPGSPSTDAQGRTYTTRTRIFDIARASFRYVSERSYDGGRTWDATLRVEATRVAAVAPR